MQGQTVVGVKEKKDVLGGGSDGGYKIFWGRKYRDSLSECLAADSVDFL
jgi:hypothetical protein